MSSRIRRPETVKLDISQGDWLLVKKHLTAGEQRQIFRRMLASDGSIEPVNVGLSKMIGYLVDWSITDPDGKKVEISDQSDDVVAAALDSLDVDSYREILTAVETHEKQMQAVRDAEKNGKDGVSTSSPISPSASSWAGGDTSGLASSIQTSAQS